MVELQQRIDRLSRDNQQLLKQMNEKEVYYNQILTQSEEKFKEFSRSSDEQIKSLISQHKQVQKENEQTIKEIQTELKEKEDTIKVILRKFRKIT